MNERGTYGGNGHTTNGHSALGCGGYGPPASGIDWKRSGLMLLTMFGGAFVGSVVDESPKKGAVLGVVGGFFASLMMEQSRELKRINQQLAQQR